MSKQVTCEAALAHEDIVKQFARFIPPSREGEFRHALEDFYFSTVADMRLIHEAAKEEALKQWEAGRVSNQ